MHFKSSPMCSSPPLRAGLTCSLPSPAASFCAQFSNRACDLVPSPAASFCRAELLLSATCGPSRWKKRGQLISSQWSPALCLGVISDTSSVCTRHCWRLSAVPFLRLWSSLHTVLRTIVDGLSGVVTLCALFCSAAQVHRPIRPPLLTPSPQPMPMGSRPDLVASMGNERDLLCTTCASAINALFCASAQCRLSSFSRFSG